MRFLLNLLVLCMLIHLTFAAPQAVSAQSASACSTPPANLTVKPEVILDCLRAGQPVEFDGVTVGGDLDLTSLNVDAQLSIVIPVELTITRSHFAGALIAFGQDNDTTLTFQQQVDLRGSQFNGNVDFTAAAFEKFAHFENTSFNVGANFNQAVFQRGASFRNTHFEAPASFMLVKVSGGFDSAEAQFTTLANFSRFHSIQNPDILLQADIFFSGARFTGGVYFMDAIFENPVYFNAATFVRSSQDDAVRFTNATFTLLNLTGAQMETGQLDLQGLRYEKFEMPNFQPSILAVQNGVEELPALMNNFRAQGSPEIANEIAYWQYGLKRQDSPRPKQLLETIFLDWTFGYGYKPLRAVKTSVFLILLFSIFYYPAGILRPAVFAPSKPRDRKFSLRLSELPIAPEEEPAETTAPHRYLSPLPIQVIQSWRAIVFSFGVFTKLSFGNYVAVRRAGVVVIEWIIGLMMIAGFLFSLANTNSLLRSMLDFIR